MFRVAIVLMLTLLVAGCGNSGAPGCSDSDVTDLVVEIATEQIQNQLVLQGIISEWGQSPQSVGNPTYAYLLEHKDSDERIQSLLAAVDEQVATLEFSVSGIRTSSADDEVKKCECGAELSGTPGNSITVEYTAQYTEDGQLYVEVYGL